MGSGFGMSVALAAAVFVRLALATDHTVGSPGGSWDQLTDLQSWATSNKFVVGDNLDFVYSSMHDVVEVTKADYDSCTATSGGIMSDASGKTRVALKAAGKRYFICGIPGHCDLGMKILVTVLPATKLATSASHSPSKAKSSPPPSSPSPPPAASPDQSPAAPPPSSSSPAASTAPARLSSTAPSLDQKTTAPSPSSAFRKLGGEAMVLALALLIMFHGLC